MAAQGPDAKMTEVLTFEPNDDNTLQVRHYIYILCLEY